MNEKENNKENEHQEDHKENHQEKSQNPLEAKVEELGKETNSLQNHIHELQEKSHEYQKKFEEADKSADEWKNKYYQVYADMANTRKQVQKENDEFKQYAQQSLVEELIPTLDSFDMALKNKPEDEKLKNYLQGFEMIHSKLLNSLKQQGVEILEPKAGDEYNPNCMQAFDAVEGDEANKVHDVFVKGYKLHDHLLRPAGVTITRKREKKPDDEIPVKDGDEKEAEPAEKKEDTENKK